MGVQEAGGWGHQRDLGVVRKLQMEAGRED